MAANDPMRPTFSQLTVTQPPIDYVTEFPEPPDGYNSGSIIVNGDPDRAAVIMINASTSPDSTGPLPPATLRFNLNGKCRWGIRKNHAVEYGGNTGSDFEVESFNDNGTHYHFPITITRADDKVTLSCELASTRACASGYTRVGPNLCMRDAGGLQVFNSSTSCAQTTALTGVITAKAVMVTVSLVATSKNAKALRQVTLQAFGQTDNTCLTALDSSVVAAYEFNATATGTIIINTTDSRVFRSDASGQFYAKTINNSSGTGFVARYTIVGYLD